MVGELNNQLNTIKISVNLSRDEHSERKIAQQQIAMQRKN